jgi:poly-beta-1,6-N-acetyl-D-glucosamine synthase
MFFSHLYHTATLFTWIIAGIMVCSLAVQLIYYLVIYLRFVRHRDPGFPERIVPVSVIICARNEAENLERNLPSFLTQDYPDYEVVVVNDCSTDTTEDVLMNLKMKFHTCTIQPFILTGNSHMEKSWQ